MKRSILSLLIAVCLFIIISCTPSPADTPLPKTMPEKTAVLFSSLAEIWLEAGGSVDITVGESIERGFVPEGTPLVDSGAGKTVNAELLLSMNPDFVICSSDIPAQTELVPLLKSAGIPFLSLQVESFGDYVNTLKIFSSITGNTAAYDHALTMQKEIRDILTANASDSSILFIRAGSSASSTKAKCAEDHFACAMLEEFGCYNIADDAPHLLDGLSIEAILLADPDYIFFSLMGSEDAAQSNVEALLSEITWQSLTAVKEGRVHILPKESFHFKPNSRWVEAYSILADLLKKTS